jgi:hypothetical protein
MRQAYIFYHFLHARPIRIPAVRTSPTSPSLASHDPPKDVSDVVDFGFAARVLEFLLFFLVAVVAGTSSWPTGSSDNGRLVRNW